MAYQIERSRFHLQEHYQQGYVAVVPENTKPQDLEDPAYFAPVSNLCRPSGRIFVECEDGSWVADLYIKGVGPQFVLAKILQVFDLSEVKAPEIQSPGYRIEWAGRHHKWRVVREEDKAVVQKELGSQQEAQAWLNNHLVAVTR